MSRAPRVALLLSVLALLGAGEARAQSCPSRAFYPTDVWSSRAGLVESSRAAEIAALEDYAFTLQGEDAERLGPRTDAVLIVQGGEIVYEHYARGWTYQMPHLAWSVTKSTMSALTGIAVGSGLLNLNDSICIHVEPALEELCDVTVQDLLEFASGIDWKETYENESNQQSSVLAMLYGEGREDVVRFITSHPLRHPPGETYTYSSGDTTLLAGVLASAFEPLHGREWPHALLYERLGMRTAVLERDARGVPIGSSYLYATARDLARFGLFALDDGCWEGARLLPVGWMDSSTTVSRPFENDPRETGETDVQGWQWWLNQPVPAQEVSTPYPALPEDAFMANGHWGQQIVIIPSLDMVIVRVADDRDGSFERNTFFELALAVGRETP
ncbi:MAG: serine hydrolase [Deltaproteobacteria bacterium]|nr:serine hydrolase [Deltaproteobacteria bacterium]